MDGGTSAEFELPWKRLPLVPWEVDQLLELHEQIGELIEKLLNGTVSQDDLNVIEEAQEFLKKKKEHWWC